VSELGPQKVEAFVGALVVGPPVGNRLSGPVADGPVCEMECAAQLSGGARTGADREELLALRLQPDAHCFAERPGRSSQLWILRRLPGLRRQPRRFARLP
jgi:hypothetical protein